MNITIITYRGEDIELTTTKDEIKWTIQRGNNKYGKGAIIPSKKLEDIAGVMGTIIINAIETIQELDKQGIKNDLIATNVIKPKVCKSKTSSKGQKKSLK
jgi:transketolase C-terminal domain/subunit